MHPVYLRRRHLRSFDDIRRAPLDAVQSYCFPALCFQLSFVLGIADQAGERPYALAYNPTFRGVDAAVSAP
jgi:hypothetical protein